MHVLTHSLGTLGVRYDCGISLQPHGQLYVTTAERCLMVSDGVIRDPWVRSEHCLPSMFFVAASLRLQEEEKGQL